MSPHSVLRLSPSHLTKAQDISASHMNLTQMSESIHGLGHLTRAHRSSEPTQMKKPEELHEFLVGKNLPLRNCPRLLTNSSSQGACLLASWCWYRDAVLGFQCTAWCVCVQDC
ncbi:hypothetical protein HBH56_151150 [Parastagonospora nodorum]|uniref:Uncharacterized protein n=1 Tax=Phaeosphaeria nodorum (strain SN15 / ATCC MYA-4574 / FGSC 10173) TaxID=321614 RepID=A0A7U2F0K3_PHANO|nr:hypothetical protein HBH56_151150 [Parastagonospora nodorum]QRC94324.1 hypothetical protein JI435_405650 [Parastagonospora nodorum SN15]KAH3928523.1 hypothetical protein HBH54_137050 [Parastagonospora nodorum]KAH4142614.1 hypothetical protein HBH45_053160 [Parastagonospora nodorum]KAH4156008.1 hypothetical protein HBH44_129900 [Parastagonospora nodorum]